MGIKLDTVEEGIVCASLNYLPRHLDAKVTYAMPSCHAMVKDILTKHGYEVRELSSASKELKIEAMNHYRTITDWSAYNESTWIKAMEALQA